MGLAGYTTPQLTHPRVTRALEALHRNKSYVPNVKPAVPMGILRQVIINLDKSQEHAQVRAALLIQFYGALRKSEVTPPSVNRFNHTCHLTRGDACVREGLLQLTIKAAKNMQRTDQRRTITLQSSDDRDFCVVTALQQATRDPPTASSTDPLLMFKDRAPVPVTFIQSVWESQLCELGLRPNAFTLHGLRTAAATEAYNSGIPELDIQKYGGWKSNVHRQYIRKADTRRLNKTLIKCLRRP